MPLAWLTTAAAALILAGAVTRTRVRMLGLLSTVAFIVQLTSPLFSVFGHPFSWRDLILIAGGLFLIVKATREIHQDIEGEDEEGGEGDNQDLTTRDGPESGRKAEGSERGKRDD